jgi:ribosomal peptide maturation radical SAM protein 1
MDVARCSPAEPAVVLVNMPASAVERPSIALGLLKAILGAAGMQAEILYANLWFLDHVGRADFILLDGFRPEEAVVDWAFGASAFPEFQPDHERFIELLCARNTLAVDMTPAALRTRLLQLRAQIPSFVDWAASRVLARRPHIVGCTSTFQQHVASLALLRRIKQLSPETVTVMGGANCESVMGRTTHEHFPWVDYVVSGEADGFIVPLFQAIAAQGADVPLDELPFGVFAPGHRAAGYPVAPHGDGVPRAITEDIRSLPLPDYTDYFEQLHRSTYAQAIRVGLPMEFSRGCWWGQRSHCTFCGLNGGSMNFRAKPPEEVAAAMRSMAERYGTTRIEAVDNIMDLAYFNSVLPELATQPNDLSIFFETKSNLKRHQVALLAKANVKWLQPGIESLHSGVLSLMRKGTSGWTNVQLLKWGRQYGVRLSWSLLCEFPGEDDDWYSTMADWIPSITHLQPGPVASLRFDRYSPYFNDPARFGLRLRPSQHYQFAYPLPPDALADQVYFFEAVREPAAPPASRPGLTAVRQEIARWRRAWSRAALPMLVLREEAGLLVVDDTRPVTNSVLHRLDEVESAALLLSDDAPPEARLHEALQRDGYTAAAVADAIARLLELRLILRMDNRLIGLPLREPCGTMPTDDAFPGGVLLNLPSALNRLLALA